MRLRPGGAAPARGIARRRRAVFVLCLLLPGCAGFKGGWESVAYLGDTPPPDAAEPLPESAAAGPPALHVPGATLTVTIDNQLRTYDTQLYLGLPLSVNPRDAYPQNNVPGKTRVFVSVTPEAPGFVFRPLQAWFEIGEQRVAAARGFEFGMWDAQGKRVEKDGRWDHRDVGAEFVLAEAGRRYLLSLEFGVPSPSPESRHLRLHLGDALRDPARAPLPVIRFAPARWKQGYS